MKEEQYQKTVELLLKILPFALKDERMALKGGTAINLFHRDFPRLSVDIDLCYLPLEDRETTYKNIHSILAAMKKELEEKLTLKVSASKKLDGKGEAKLVAIAKGIEVKIEPNFILRSSLFKPVDIDLAGNAKTEFKLEVTARCLNLADSYGGKICAALDRQHPRDLFDIKFLLENEGITEDVKNSFIFYLISHKRPINELLNPNLKDISQVYKDEFVDMAKVNVPENDLLKARESLIANVKKSLNAKDREFLISFASNKPKWGLVFDSKIKDYPSVKWILHNQDKLERSNGNKHKEYIKKVEALF